MKNVIPLKQEFIRDAFIFLICLIGPLSTVMAQRAGNPIFPGDHPDPEVRLFDGRYYVYPTNEGPNEFHAYSSSDLTNWVDEGTIFSLRRDCPWANNNGWAPSVINRNNKYYLYYTAEAKIGCAVSDSPTGPFVDLGYPFIANDAFTVDIIDAMAFIDDDGQAYLYYGGSNGARMVARRLNPDMTSFASGPVDITPQNYTEAPFLVKRDGIYYMTYSNGQWFNGTYNVQYSTSDSPLGPWTYGGSILSSADNITGPGHHSILQIPGCDDYYMVYHRYDNGQRFRTCNMDRMYFNPDSSIRKVKMTFEGVQARTPFGNECSAGNILSGATYKLIHKGTNKALDVTNNSSANDANVIQYDDNGGAAQQWVITKEADGFFKLRHKGTNKCLDVVNNSSAPGANVIQYQDNGGDAQRWNLQAMEDGFYKIVHKGTNNALDVDNNLSTNGANVQQWTDNGNDAQRWKIEIVQSTEIENDVVYELEPECAPGKRLDVAGGVNANGTNVGIYQSNNNIAQAWRFRGVGGGLWELIPEAAPERRLDVAGGQNLEGSNMHLWQSNGGPAQRFRFLDQGNGYFEIEPQIAPGKRLDVANRLQDNGTNVLIWFDLNNSAQRWRLIKRNGIPEPVALKASIAVSSQSKELNSESGQIGLSPFPNPFATNVEFPIDLDSTGEATLTIFDMEGRVVKMIKSMDRLDRPTVQWNGENSSGSQVVPGLYIYRMEQKGEVIGQGKIIKLME